MYNSAIVNGFVRLSDAKLQLNVTYSGNAGEPPINDPIYMASDVLDADAVRRQAKRKIDILNASEAVIDVVEAALPYTIDITTPFPPPAASTFGQFMAASIPFTPGATPQDVFTLSNPGAKKITVIGAGLSSIQTTAGQNYWALVARTSLHTGGTPATVSPVPTASGFPSVTAEVQQWTGNPTGGGALAGRLWSGRVSSPTATGVGDVSLDLTPTLQRMSLTLPTNGVLAFNFNGAALPAGLSVSAWFAWIEN